MTITIPNVFGNCHNPLSSTAPLPYKGILLVNSVDNNGNNPIQLDYKEWSSSPSNPGAPFTFTVNVAAKGYFTFKIVEQATACSTCAPTQEESWICLQQTTSTGRTAAKPKWEMNTGLWTWEASWNVPANQDAWYRTADPESCGCVVPF